MMGALTKYLTESADTIRADLATEERDLREWEQATRSLMSQLETWLREADEQKLLRTILTEEPHFSHAVGTYLLPRLTVLLRDNSVEVKPESRARGGVIKLPGEQKHTRTRGGVQVTNGRFRLPLYRVKGGDADRWYWWKAGNLGHPLDRDNFEAQVVGLLRDENLD